ncbi:hypothetical protein CYMTET_4154 [Cymbomonas tetramitiformis]|uniref:Phospho-N-acetylmuramoyl-pentapeptide-transferase n=1 Tax=Cymbomonas tetramitiformis TaxID=36881 RepID=A0AAE0H1X1_9CHLO|nr:hypothetical protein CYMTET_4154 [Cymbomonas tetramitiformis]
MGDTGSLALGGSIASVAVVAGPSTLLPLFLCTAVFAMEALSVVVQVGYYKATKDNSGKGKRLLRMAPLHHHFELGGWSEVKIVKVAYILNAAFSLLAIIAARYV